MSLPNIEIEDEIIEKTPESIIRENIEKANRLLDFALDNAMTMADNPRPVNEDPFLDIANKRENFSSRRIEVIAKLIDTITTAADKLIIAQNDDMGLLLKREMLQLKEKEILLKDRMGLPSKNLTQNLIVGTPTELLRLLNSDTNIIDAEAIGYDNE